jgi:hypothetical protein
VLRTSHNDPNHLHGRGRVEVSNNNSSKNSNNNNTKRVSHYCTNTCTAFATP